MGTPNALSTSMPLLTESPAGLYCPAGDFYIDPWQPVPRAVITHAHGDHARQGSKSYLAAKEGDAILRLRLGSECEYQFVEYGERINCNSVQLSLHPAGHMTGSSQVRIEHRGEVVVFTGDYKLQSDPTCRAFEPLKSHTFITESTFGMPIYRWRPNEEMFAEVNDWWRANQALGKCSVLFAYTVGKSQRLIASVDSSIGPMFGHGAILQACSAYRKCGVQLPALGNIFDADKKYDWSQALVIAPPSARGSTWLRRFGDVSLGQASGWMRVRGIRRRRAIDRGFIISDHVDWAGLLDTIKATEAQSVWVTHGYTRQVVAHLKQQGYDAREVQTQYRGEEEETETAPEEEAS
jgi:putative mRNA 3-end processing factor